MEQVVKLKNSLPQEVKYQNFYIKSTNLQINRRKKNYKLISK